MVSLIQVNIIIINLNILLLYFLLFKNFLFLFKIFYFHFYKIGTSSCCQKCTSPAVSTNDRTLCVPNYCASNPCMNNALCSNEKNGFTCTCSLGLSGTLCENLSGQLCPSINSTSVFQWTFPLQTTSIFQKNGDAILNLNSFTLTDKVKNKIGSIFYKTPVTLSNSVSFSASFGFKIDGSGGEGLVFIIAKDPTLLGTSSSLGYTGSPSLGVKFDTKKQTGNPSDNFVAVLKDGLSTLLASVVEDTPFTNNQVWYVWIDYDGTSIHVRYSLTLSRPTQPQLSAQISFSYLANEVVYFGFSASSGSGTVKHDIVSHIYFSNSLAARDSNCGSGKYYNLVTGVCSQCPLNTYSSGLLSCCTSCSNGKVNTFDNSNCTGIILFYFFNILILFKFYLIFFSIFFINYLIN